MVFSSTVFLFLFLPVVYILYLICKNNVLRNAILIFASLFFYAYGEPMAVVIMIFSIIVNYLLGLGVSNKKYRTPILVIAVVFNVGVLFVFKYLDFVLSLISGITAAPSLALGIKLPIGISFFTFQAMSYVIDAYKDNSLIEKNIFNIFLYISFFPQLIAGPIIKFSDVAKQIKCRSITLEKTVYGIRRFIFGLSKKLLIANTMGAIADIAYSSETDNMSALSLWIAAICYMFQIFFDFSGYSDMAIGLGKMFGFDFKENFNYPYSSSSMKDFWRRWNISVSTWFKEYVYIPLGGNRKGKLRTNINKFIVFFLTGLWHGANLTFVLWGLIHGLFLTLENYGLVFFLKGKGIVARAASHIYALLVVLLTFVFFRADTISQALIYIKQMFSGFSGEFIQSSYVLGKISPYVIITAVFAALLSTPVVPKIKARLSAAGHIRLCEAGSCVVALALFVLCVLSLSSAEYNPFIYFRF